ncbi:MAG: tetratricopeptide repeat protein [Phycisphaerae bacterium]|nr:tetratricopeptide repeat protein [Phycisphaerae bacterium]
MRKSHKTSEYQQQNRPPSPTPGLSRPGLGKWAIILTASICVAIAGFWAVKNLSDNARNTQQEGVPVPLDEQPEHSAAPAPSAPDQNVTALKEEQLKFCEELMKEFPDNENAFVIMGETLRGHGNAIEARKFYEKALKINPMRPDVHIIMSELDAKEGKFEESIAHLQKVLNMQPQAPDIHGRIGELLMRLGKLDKAVESFEREMQIAPSAGCYFLIGQSYLMQKENEKAKENYEAAIKIDPEHERSHYGLATVYAKLGNSDKAKEHFEICKRLKAQSREGLKAARTLKDDIIQTRKNSAVNHIKAGQMYRSDGKLQKAEELLQHASELDPENVGCLLELASLYQQTNQRPEVRRIHTKIRRLELKYADNCIIFGDLSVDLELLDDAEEAYRNAITLAPQKSVAYRKLAHLYLKTRKQLPQARQLAEKAVALDQTATNYFLLGLACIGNGDRAGAVRAVKRAVELEPRNAQYQRYYDLIRK